MILKTRLFYRQWTRNKTSRKLHLPQLQDCLSPTVWRQCRKYRDSVTSHQVIRRHQQNIHSLKRFFSRPMKIWAGPQKDGLIFQASIFRGEKCKLVSGISNKNTKNHRKVSMIRKNLGGFPAQGPKGSRRKTLHVWPPPTAKIQILSIFPSKDETCGCFQK